jgi:hypothetical protein
LLVSTTPAVGVSGGGPASATFFAEGGGYSTEFVRFPSPGAAH